MDKMRYRYFIRDIITARSYIRAALSACTFSQERHCIRWAVCDWERREEVGEASTILH